MTTTLTKRLEALERIAGIGDDGPCPECYGRNLAHGVRYAEPVLSNGQDREPERCPRCGRAGPVMVVEYD